MCVVMGHRGKEGCVSSSSIQGEERKLKTKRREEEKKGGDGNRRSSPHNDVVVGDYPSSLYICKKRKKARTSQEVGKNTEKGESGSRCRPPKTLFRDKGLEEIPFSTIPSSISRGGGGKGGV